MGVVYVAADLAWDWGMVGILQFEMAKSESLRVFAFDAVLEMANFGLLAGG